MLIFGIYRLDQLHARHLRTRRGRRRFVAATLYPEVCDSSHPDKDRLLELVLCQFANANRTYKRTYSDRFRQFDQAIVQQLTGSHRPGTLRVHDLAVSNGITAVELYRLLSPICDGKIDYVASDLSPGVVAVRDGKVTLILDPTNHTCLQLIRPPFVFNLQKKENARRFPVNWLVRRWLEATQCNDLQRRYVAGDPKLQIDKIELLHPACQQLVDNAAPFTFRSVDIMEPMEGPYDLVRAMNILNPGYFREHELRKAITNIHASLVIGGLFATGSNQASDSSVDGAIYRKTHQGFEQLYQTGSGSPADAHIVGDRRLVSK